MNEEKQRIIDKISKILIQAKDQAGTPEGDTFKSNAARLMAKYRIQETEVDLETDSFCLDTFEFENDGSRNPQWVGRIVSIFAHTFDCQTVSRKTYSGKEWEFIGTFSDVETALYFTEIVCHHIEKEVWKTWSQETYSGKREQTGNVASDVIWYRAYELKDQMDTTIHEDENCSALVVQKTKEVEDALAELYPKIKTARAKKIKRPMDIVSIEAGKRAGETAPLNFAIEA